MSKNHQNQKNTVDPSKAIRNMGLGSSRKYSKNRFNRNVNIKEKMEPTEKLLNKTDEVHSTTNQNPSFLLIQSHSFAFEMPKQPIKHAKQPVGKRTSDSFRLNNIGHSATAQEKSVPISNEQLKTLPSYNNSEKWSSLASSSTFRPDHSSFMLRNETRRNALQENAYSSAIDSTVIDSGDSDNSEIGISGVKQLSCTTINDLNKTVVGSNQSSTTYKFQDLSNVSDDESVGSASALAHNTCIRMEKTCNELRKLNLNNHSKKMAEKNMDGTLMPTFEQLTPKFKNIENRHANMPIVDEMPATSTENFTQVVYVREADLNRLIKRGNINFVKGKLHYTEIPPNN